VGRVACCPYDRGVVGIVSKPHQPQLFCGNRRCRSAAVIREPRTCSIDVSFGGCHLLNTFQRHSGSRADAGAARIATGDLLPCVTPWRVGLPGDDGPGRAVGQLVLEVERVRSQSDSGASVYFLVKK
jgi:hypothetical protein